MRRPLPFKERVRLPDALPQPPPVRPSTTARHALLIAGGLTWLGATALGLLLHFGWSTPEAARDAGSPSASAHSLAASSGEQPDPSPEGGAATSPRSAEAPPPAAPGALPTCEELLPKVEPRLGDSSALPRDLTGSGYGALVDQTATQRTFGHCARVPLQLELCVILEGGGVVAATVISAPKDEEATGCLLTTLRALPFRYHEAPLLLRSRPWLVPHR